MKIMFWKDPKEKKLDPELFSSQAEALAKEIHGAQTATANNPTQLRRFYDEVLRFDSRLKELPKEKQKDEFEKNLPYLKMMNAKAAYSQARNLISANFKSFISDSLGQINNNDDFQVFKSFFEAFMGFYKFFDKLGERSNQGGRR